MIKQEFGNGGLRTLKFFGGVFLAFMVLWLFLTIGSFRFGGSLRSMVPDYEFNGQKAFAGEQDFEEAFVDSYLYDDTLIVIDTTAAPGDDFWLTVSLTNNTIEVAGFDLLLEYDTSIIYPDYIITDPCYPDTPSCPLFSIEGYKTARTDPPPYYVWGGRAFNNHIDTLKFAALMNPFTQPAPHLPPGGSGPVVRFKFWVKPHAQPGATTPIQFIMWDPETGNPANTINDTLGAYFIPVLRDGIFTATSDEHNELGHIFEGKENRTWIVDKRFRKLKAAARVIPAPELRGEPEADLTFVGWGSTKGPIREAMKMLARDGVRANFLQLVYLSPFPAKRVGEILSKARKLILVENNKTAQLGGVIREHTGVLIPDQILRYDGRPFTPEKIHHKVMEVL